MSFAGGYISGAYAGDELIGASAGFLGRRAGELHLHSHISGVIAARQSRHVGVALKQHQRAWALARGIDSIEWTFDPLVRRNAFFNLVKLGAEVVGIRTELLRPDARRDQCRRRDRSRRCPLGLAVCGGWAGGWW